MTRHALVPVLFAGIMAAVLADTPRCDATNHHVQLDEVMAGCGGDLHIQDKTVPELIEAVRSAYSKILRDPVITVELKDFEKPYFIVGGEVARPGKYDLRGDTTILEAVTMAGDLKAQSNSSQVLLFRRASKDLVEVKQLNLKRILRTRNLAEDTYLRPGDMVFVPKSILSKLDRFMPVPSLGMFFNPFTF